MTENIEQTIAQLAKERAKTILENSDFWSGPGSSKTSAEAVGTLLSYRWQLETAPATATEKDPDSLIDEAIATAKELLREVGELPPVEAKPARKNAKTKEPETNAEPESPDA